MNGASIRSNSWGLNTVLPITLKRSTVNVSGASPGVGVGIVRIGGGDCSNSSGGGRVSGVGASGWVGSIGGTTSCGGGVGGFEKAGRWCY